MGTHPKQGVFVVYRPLKPMFHSNVSQILLGFLLNNKGLRYVPWVWGVGVMCFIARPLVSFSKKLFI